VAFYFIFSKHLCREVGPSQSTDRALGAVNSAPVPSVDDILVEEANHKEGSLSEKNSSSSTEPEFSPIQPRVEMIQMIADSRLASFLSHLKESSPRQRALINRRRL